MKKILLAFMAFSITLSGIAQITVNRSDYAAVGDWYLLASDTSLSVSTGNALRVSGANVTWDISGWANRHTKDTTFYANGFTFPGAPAGCNLVSYTVDPVTMETLPTYFIASNSNLKIIFEAGMATGNGGALKVFQFPSTMGTKYKDSIENFFTTLAADLGINIPLIDSVKIIYKVRMNSEIDAYGKLKMDAGTFDVLRQKLVNEVLVSFKVRNILTGTYTDLPGGAGFGGFNEKTNTYTWVSANGGHPLLMANEDTSGVMTDMEFILASSRGLSSGLDQLNPGKQLSSKAFPVPASEHVTIELNAPAKSLAQVKVLDILGNEVSISKEVQIQTGLNQIPVSISHLKPGIYFYSIEGGDFQSSNKFTVK